MKWPYLAQNKLIELCAARFELKATAFGEKTTKSATKVHQNLVFLEQ